MELQFFFRCSYSIRARSTLCRKCKQKVCQLSYNRNEVETVILNLVTLTACECYFVDSIKMVFSFDLKFMCKNFLPAIETSILSIRPWTHIRIFSFWKSTINERHLKPQITILQYSILYVSKQVFNICLCFDNVAIYNLNETMTKFHW